MRRSLWTKGLVLGIIMLFVGTGIIPSELKICASNVMSSASIELIINNDGSGDPTDKNVDIPAYIPDSGITPMLTINFTITGVNNTGSTAFYGDDPGEDWKNISVFGDILYPLNATTIYHVGTKGDWHCCVTPTKPYGIISLRIDWPGNGSANNSIQIVNGSFVTPLVDWFAWGHDFNISVTVKDLDIESLKYADVYLIWEEDDLEFNHTMGDNTVGNGWNGEYTFRISKEDQGEFAPKNITIAVHDVSSGLSGYAKVTMKQSSPPPIPPIITGLSCGKINREYTFSLGAISDPEGDLFYCLWDWGDGTAGEWLGPYNSGEIIQASHTWNEPETYSIKVKLKDNMGNESDWSEPFTMYITSKMLFIIRIQGVTNQSETYTIFNISFAVILHLKPFNLKKYHSVQILMLLNEFQGVIGPRFLAGRVYALVL